MKENLLGPSCELSDKQRTRITQNFRAAKALLARKRPHQVIAHPGYGHKLSTNEIKTDTSVCNSAFTQISDDADNPNLHQRDFRIHRTPLTEIQINAQIASSSNGVQSLYTDCSRSCFKTGPLHNNEITEEYGLLAVEDGFPPAKVVTPAKQSDSHSCGDSYSSPDILDAEFDDTLLREIDAICEQQTTGKKGRRSCLQVDLSGESHVMLLYKSRDDAQGSLGLAEAEKLMEDEKLLNSKIDLEQKELRSSRTAQESVLTRIENEAEISSSDVSVSSHAAQKSKEHEIPVENTNYGSQSTKTSTSDSDQNGCAPPAYSEYLQSLNDTQREAASSDLAIPLMIVAGPGSGKTSTMVGRVLTFLKEGIGPIHILAMTFTTAAASEMRERIGAVAGKAIAKELTICTFHSFCLQLCRLHAEKLARTSEFLIYGHGQQRRAIIESVRLIETERKSDHNCNTCKPGEDFTHRSVAVQSFKDKSRKWQKFVTQAKAAGKTAEDYQKMGDEKGAAILRHYDDILRSCNALDYHDLISSSVKLLTDFPEVLKECQALWNAIVVDEFQDTSAMQYSLLQILASHNCLTVVGDEDQSIFSFNGADMSGFDSFRKDFSTHKEIRLQKNYRSTRCIVEAASSLIKNNLKRCQLKQVFTDNASGCKITIKECHNEDAQCAFVVDKILEVTSDCSDSKCSFGSIAVLYRRQVSGKVFQTAFRNRRIAFNVHGVAFYRKKVVKAIMAMLRTALSGCDDGPFRQVFKALFPGEKEERKRVIEYIDKISTTRKCSFISAACDIFGAKISGTFSRCQLSQGRKVLFMLDMISKLVKNEGSISMVIASVANMLPQKYLLEQRAVINAEGGKLLNEDDDLRSVLQYLLDDVSDFLSAHFTHMGVGKGRIVEAQGCSNVLKAFIDYISAREVENFRSRRGDNKNSISLTTIHQSKGLEWDTVFIVKANDSEIPLLHESNGFVEEGGTTLEEERRLLYVAMTRAKRKLYILYIIMDSSWQLLQPSRFLKEIPYHLLEVLDETPLKTLQTTGPKKSFKHINSSISEVLPVANMIDNNCQNNQVVDEDKTELSEACFGNTFLKRFNLEDRSTISHLFHQWAKKQAFQNPKRLLDKVGFVVDERLRSKTCKSKDAMRSLKSTLRCDAAFQYAEYVLQWEQIPVEKRVHLLREKQEHFQKQRIENSMSSSAASSKQIAYLQSLGCTVVPTSRLHASHLIEQYKSL